MLSVTVFVQTLLALSCVCLAAPYHMFPRVIVPQEHFEVLKLRASTSVDPNAVADTTCLDASK